MNRRRRILIPDKFYHIVCRGNRREPLFRERNDFIEILHMLAGIYEKIPYELVAYCFMTNHFHLQLRSRETSISKVMSLLNKRYAIYYNTKYRLTGHVFEKRFYSEVIDDAAGMLAVSRYIFLNPVKANIVKAPEHYPWSSFRFYTNPSIIPPKYIQINYLLKYFAGNIEERRGKLVDYVKNSEISQ